MKSWGMGWEPWKACLPEEGWLLTKSKNLEIFPSFRDLKNGYK
jgi:hypothetical protein